MSRILQEKAEALRKKRQSAEAVQKEVDERVAQLEQLGIVPVGVADGVAALRDLVRRSDWEQVETQAQTLLEQLASTVPATIEARRHRTADALARLTGAGVPIPPAISTEIAALTHPPPDAAWSETVGRLAGVEQALRGAATAYLADARTRAIALAKWAGVPPGRLVEVERRLPDPETFARDDRLADGLTAIERLIADGLPEAAEKRRAIRASAEQLRATAQELGATTGALDAALRADSDARPIHWPETVGAVEVAMADAGGGLRERGAQALDALLGSLKVTSEFGVDPAPARAAVETAAARLATASPLEIGPLLAEARRQAEEPIVSVVAGLLDEVRPRIAGARRLGRDPTDVFAAMNRAREALRLKIYSEALAASQEALDQVSRLTEDLDAARDELATVEEMLSQFRAVGFASEQYEPAIGRVRSLVDRAEIGPARAALKELLSALGRDALQFFTERWTALERLRDYARERGFLPGSADRGLTEGKALLDAGDLANAAERISRSEVELRNAAGPYVARRVEEMQRGFEDVPDDTLTAPVRRFLADADVTLRVKQDVVGSIESLRRAERDFSAVFAARASALVEGLESEVRVLESMGGPSDEIQRQIDEIQQIFNMGDFVKASRASQEIRTRAQQQQLLRSEEALSHAKLSLVELEAMGLDLSSLRPQLEAAQSEARAGHHAEAYRAATRLEAAAGQARGAAQGLIDRISRMQDLLGRLQAAGADPQPFYQPLKAAREALREFAFDRSGAILEDAERALVAAGARLEADRSLGDLNALLEEGRRLGAPIEPLAARLEKLRTEAKTAPPEATRTGAKLLHEEGVALLRPILEENLRSLERDLDVARAAGIAPEPVVKSLAEARRRIALPTPTGAAALLDEARNGLVSTHGFVEHAERVAKRVREALAQADLLRTDIAKLRSRAEELEKLLADRQYARVAELGGSIERELLQSTYQHVSKTLAGFQATVTQLRRKGGNTSIAENLLHQARMALDEGRPLAAVQLATQSESELERVDLQQRIAEGCLEAAERSIARAVEDGVIAGEALREARAARLAFAQGTYSETIERCIASSDHLSGAVDGHRRAREAVEAAETQIADATKLRAEPKDAVARLQEARQEAGAGRYSVAVRLAREATEMARWSVERIFASPIDEIRRQVEAARAEGLAAELAPVEALVQEAETAARAHQWDVVRSVVEKADQARRAVFDGVVDARWREVEADGPPLASLPESERARREEVKTRVATLRRQGDLAGALKLLQGEVDLVQAHRREEVAKTMTELRDRLWVGERLGVDTTPVMQTFGEARVALDARRVGPAAALVEKAEAALESAVRTPFARRRKEIQSEVTFAEDGLRVSVGAVRERLKETDELVAKGKLLEGARTMLKAEEDLNTRKSLHRELTNLHYLIDAALARAEERRIDTREARQLLAESLQLREADYAAALAKARQALQRLQHDGVTVTEGGGAPPSPPSATPFWPFRRPPPS